MIPIRDIHIMIPAYNEGTVLREVIESIHQHGFDKVIVVDDGSHDQTAEVARQAGARVIRHLVNRGAGAAVQTAISLAREQDWPYVVFMDGDGQHSPEDIFKMTAKMEESNCDLVIGSRFLKIDGKIPWTRIVFNYIANIMTNIFCKKRYTDSQSGLRLLNRNAIQKINLEIDRFGFCSEMLISAESQGLEIGEAHAQIKYSAYSINKGQDFQIGITTALNFLWNLFFK